MRPILNFILILLFGACANTTVRDRQSGVVILKTQSNAKELHFASGDTRLDIIDLDNATPTRAQGEAASQKIGAVGSAAAAAGVMAIFK